MSEQRFSCDGVGTYAECQFCTKSRPQTLEFIGEYVPSRSFRCEIENKQFCFKEVQNEVG